MLQINERDQMCLLALIIIQNVPSNEGQTLWLKLRSELVPVPWPEHSFLLVLEHQFGNRAGERVQAPEVVLGHRARARTLV